MTLAQALGYQLIHMTAHDRIPSLQQVCGICTDTRTRGGLSAG